MTFGILGLGLIGASMAKTIKVNINAKIAGFDIDEQVLKTALEDDVIDEVLSEKSLSKCDVIIIALCPKATVDFIKKQRKHFKNGALVLDICGVKSAVLEPIEELVKESSFIFIGGHPMAGTENSGYEFSSPTLFCGSSMILTPFKWTKSDEVEQAKALFLSLGFGEIKITTASEHDRIIAFTSQLAHIVSNAYVKSPTAQLHHGFSAGSYRDLTRVARLNEDMWTELFLENSTPLAVEIDNLCEQLKQYSDAIKSGDEQALKQLLKNGREIKEQVDKI
ncbi:MAG: prephenate dehydrogenase [Oscillospiraceae bacterium]